MLISNCSVTSGVTDYAHSAGGMSSSVKCIHTFCKLLVGVSFYGSKQSKWTRLKNCVSSPVFPSR